MALADYSSTTTTWDDSYSSGLIEEETTDTSEEDSTTTADRTGGPTGSAYLEITQDPDTGEVNEELTGSTGGLLDDGATESEETADDVTVTTVSTTDTDLVEDTEQAVEDATGGTAFGDPTEVDDVTDATRDWDLTESGEIEWLNQEAVENAANEAASALQGETDLSDLSPGAKALLAALGLGGAYVAYNQSGTGA